MMIENPKILIRWTKKNHGTSYVGLSRSEEVVENVLHVLRLWHIRSEHFSLFIKLSSDGTWCTTPLHNKSHKWQERERWKQVWQGSLGSKRYVTRYLLRQQQDWRSHEGSYETQRLLQQSSLAKLPFIAMYSKVYMAWKMIKFLSFQRIITTSNRHHHFLGGNYLNPTEYCVSCTL